MYEPTRIYKRTDAERKSQVLAWNRSDRAFFAAGACHILAYTFFDLHRDEGYDIIGLVTPQGYASHVYASNGDWAFDFNGWTRESELLSVTETSEKAVNPEWFYKRLVIKDNLETFCQKHNSRSPAYYLHLPWQRAYKYIEQFDAQPPRQAEL